MKNVLITGTNRGIGLELTKRYLGEGNRVFATCRNPDTAVDLIALDENKNLNILALDVTDEEYISKASRSIGDEPIDVLINNAGVRGGDIQSFDSLDANAWMDTFSVNTIGPMRVANSFLENLKKGNQPRLIAISSQMGSLNRKGQGSYYYRSSKAALNMAMQLMARDLNQFGIIVCPVHPGWVRTDMGGSGADISVSESGTGLKNLIDTLTMKQSGRFWTWEGVEHEW